MNKSYYAIIPANVRYDDDLTPNSKLLYGEITALTNEKGYCYETNNYFSKLYGVNKISIYKWMKQLVDKEYIKIIKENNIVEKLKNKNLYGLGYGMEICEWCGIKTSVLHNHHYPIRKSEGGTKIVKICPNCHHEYHFNTSCIQLNLSENELEEILKERETYGKRL